MANVVKRVEYYYTVVPDRLGAGAKVLSALKEARVSLLAFNGFPSGIGHAQLDFVPSSPNALQAAARKAGIKLVGPKTAFLIQGEDRVGTLADAVNKLAKERIGITAANAVSAGRGRYGSVLWVKSRNVKRAAEALKVS